MRITGTISEIGTIRESTPDLHVLAEKGILITVANDDLLREASNLFYCTVDIYPHPVDSLAPGQCTPENYAHALARLDHAEDHLYREIRSSQAAQANVKDLERRLATVYADLRHAEALNDDNGKALLAAHLEAHDNALRKQLAEQEAAKSAAWAKYLDLRRQIRGAPKGDFKTALVAEALTIAREYDLDPAVRELEVAQRRVSELEALLTEYRTNRELHIQLVAERDRTIVNMQGTINELVRKNDDLRAAKDAILVAHTGLQGLVDAYRNDANDLREDVKRLRRVLHKHDISTDTSGEECDDERGRDENGNALT